MTTEIQGNQDVPPPSQVRHLSPPPPRRKGCGCFRFFFRGCLVFILFIAIIAVWNSFPSFSKPETSRFALWPETTSKATSVLAPKDRLKLDAYTEAHYFFPLKELPGWFAAAQLRSDDVKVMTLLSTTLSEGFRLEGADIYFEKVESSVLLVDLNRNASDILRQVPGSIAVPQKLDGVEVLGFPSPRGGPSQERWYWAAPSEYTLMIGEQAAVEQVLAIAAGRQGGIIDRRVLLPILKDVENARMLELDLVPPSREASGFMKFLNAIPVVSTFASVRARSVALEELPDGGCVQKLDHQFSGRMSAAVIGSFFSLASEKDWAGKPEEVPERVLVQRKNGLVMVHMFFDAARCRATEGTGERVKLFVQ